MTVDPLESRLDRIGEAADGSDSLSLDEILEALQDVSFGSLLLLAGQLLW